MVPEREEFMDVSKENKEIVLNAIHDWLSSLPLGVVDVKEEHGEYESVVKIKPFKSKASPLEFRIGNYGTFDVAMGMGMQFNEIPISVDKVIDICKSVASGRIKEQVWISKNKCVRSNGELELSSGRWSDRGSNSWRGILGIGKKQFIEYEPYI
ncbi:hypothetical protein [Candidatus Manganitrophus noduliformans]|uniref:Uncharacterized protein n=1 Tax=Candidatus Manganitrophus noduliformans TaxID=2606439 RepID=A0A7X6IAI2_9BACT|nr:hypothetical protein [Candidatus Manganitrophus noduliformans]NKE70568.1 hypothetical protein [Candidatus Manganitrophus noduliformans]